ncbi:LTA synthase family protein [Paenibacillus sp. sgz302251]|uniref:LTA synthase family protein n=1 Tax=Paenibacillus sp. sgz302251 TaxID=3414493 RepID=UPI003C7A05BE
MLPNQQSIVRRSMGSLLVQLDRLKAVDLLLFVIVMISKLYLFSQFLALSSAMKMNSKDALIELGAVLLFSFWTIWLPTRGRIVALIVLNLIATFVLYADLIYYRYFQDLISVPVLLQFSQVDSLGGSISTLLHVNDFILFLDWIVIIPFAVYVLWRGRGDLRHANRYRRIAPGWRKASVRIVLSAIIFTIGTSLVFSHVNEAKRTWALGVFDGNWWNLSIYNVTGALGFHGYDVYRYVKLNYLDAVTVTAEQTSETKHWMEERGDLRRALEQDDLFGAYADSNVLMIQLEAFQNFVIGTSIGGQEITPHFNQLINDSAYFSQFYQQTAHGRTSDADFAANCSFQPVSSGSVFTQYASNEFDCMPTTLKKNGYSTSVFHAYEGGFWNRNAMYRNMNYDQFYSLKHFTLDEKLGWALGDKSFFKQTLDVISEQKQPFYSFLITLSSHHPYTLPDTEQKLNVGELKGTIMGDYLQAIHYVDAALGELVDRMKTEGLWDNTILVAYGDHDNSIKDWGLFEAFLNKPLSDLDRQIILKQVPLLVHLPQNEHAGTYSNIGGQTDITPTIMHLLGISTANHYLLGTPLITEKPLENKLVVQRNGGVTDGSIYFIPSADGIVENGKCWSISGNSISDSSACMRLVSEARTELSMSDQIVMSDLIERFKEQNSTEARVNRSDGKDVESASISD